MINAVLNDNPIFLSNIANIGDDLKLGIGTWSGGPATRPYSLSQDIYASHLDDFYWKYTHLRKKHNWTQVDVKRGLR